MKRSNRGEAERTAVAPPIGLFKTHSGTKALFVVGRPVPPLIIDVPDDNLEEGSAEKQAGIVADVSQGKSRIFRLRRVVPAWPGAGTEAYERLDQRLRSLSAECYYFVDIVVDAPARWLEAHAEEAARFCLERSPAQEATAGDARCASWASKRWLNDAGDAVARLVRYVLESEWGSRCLGFTVSCGPNGDWTHTAAERLPDIGQRMTERFRAYMVDKYRRNTGLLRQGWDDPRADFDRIKCPDAYERRYADLGILRNPLRSRKVLDYYECFYGTQNDSALHFCSLIKRITERRALVGIAYASPFGTASLAEAAHGLPDPIFDSPDIDFLIAASPAPGDTGLSTFNGSLQLRDKFLFVSSRPGASLALEMARAQVHLAGVIAPLDAWSAQGAEALKIATRNLQAPTSAHKRQVQVAVIVDAMQPTYLAGSDETRSTWVRAAFNEQMDEIARMGAPFDTYLLSDLFHPKFRDHKVYIFLNSLYLSEAERRRIDARVKRSDQHTVWFWGAGILTEKGTDEATAQHLQDMKVRLEKGETTLRVRIVEANDALTWGTHIGTTFGPNRTAVPTLTIGDKTAKRLGANSDNKTVFAVRRNADWTGVQYGTLPVPASLLRNVLRGASVHLYGDTAGSDSAERVIAGTGIVAVTRVGGGSVTVSLPAPHEVIDPFSGKSIANGSDIPLEVKEGEPRIIEIRPHKNTIL